MRLGEFQLSKEELNGRHISLRNCLEQLGQRGLDSVLIEGGAEVQYSALCAGVVQRLYVYVGAMLLGGAGAKSPVGGLGAPDPAEAFALGAPEIELFGRDVLLSYDVLAREKEAF